MQTWMSDLFDFFGSTIRVLWVMLLMIHPAEVAAQEADNSDVELWTGVALKHKWNKQHAIKLQHEYRFKDRAGVLDKDFTELEYKRKFSKGFSLALGARYSRTNDNEGKIQGTKERFRWQTDLGYKNEINRFSIGSRLRFQSRSDLFGDNPSVDVLRLKIVLGYNIRNWKLDPKLSTEFFRKSAAEENISKMRVTIGTDYSMGRWGEIEFLYRIEEQFAAQQNIGVWALRYVYAI
jgi:hypothetical protein